MNEDYYLCESCAKDDYIKKYVAKYSVEKHDCVICLENKISYNISEDKFFRKFCRFLIRYHFPEYVYNSHWGGDDLPELFYKNNPIISHEYANYGLESREETIETFLYELFDLNDWESEIDLYWGHDDNVRGLYPSAIKDEQSKIWANYKKKLRSENSFLFETEAKVIFSKLLVDLKFPLKKGEIYYRARIGCTEKNQKVGTENIKIKTPYRDKDMSAPPILKAVSGRANRAGVAYLYLASDSKTALSEIRPHPGHYVSIASFKSNQELLLVDLRFINLIEYFENDKKLQLFKFLKDISKELEMPILPEEREYYLITQFISDIIRLLEFDGILFNSSVFEGHNLVIFNEANFSFIKDSSELIKITEVQFKHKKIEYELDGFIEKAIEK